MPYGPGVAATRVIAGQTAPAPTPEQAAAAYRAASAPLGAPPPAVSVPGMETIAATLAGLNQSIQSLREEVVALRQDREGNGPKGYGALDHAEPDEANFFSYLPPLHVHPWERFWFAEWDAAAVIGTPTLITGERLQEGQVLILTDFTFFTTRANPGANPILMDPGETLSFASFSLLSNGHPVHETGRSGAGIQGRIVGDPLTQLNRDGFRPQYSSYHRDGALLEAYYTRLAAMTVNPQRVLCWLRGFVLPIADFQRGLAKGSLF